MVNSCYTSIKSKPMLINSKFSIAAWSIIPVSSTLTVAIVLIPVSHTILPFHTRAAVLPIVGFANTPVRFIIPEWFSRKRPPVKAFLFLVCQAHVIRRFSSCCCGIKCLHQELCKNIR